ncbi:MAG: uncharacterized protein KVP18_004274 [Porospora cf. gigantea A]|uniref:uncharacterized protein n=1 Tax=Porospora cf. gigantea A TaxID=2853593 RepID=UPI003559F3C0|nr:MAG: hypothetical protein KVP18_004274 [Porospora cf. gigantea A]
MSVYSTSQLDLTFESYLITNMSSDETPEEPVISYHVSTSTLLPLESVQEGAIFSKRIRGGLGSVWAQFGAFEECVYKVPVKANLPYVDAEEWKRLGTRNIHNAWGWFNRGLPEREKQQKEPEPESGVMSPSASLSLKSLHSLK